MPLYLFALKRRVLETLNLANITTGNSHLYKVLGFILAKSLAIAKARTISWLILMIIQFKCDNAVHLPNNCICGE